jgi:hypothetical protein
VTKIAQKASARPNLSQISRHLHAAAGGGEGVRKDGAGVRTARSCRPVRHPAASRKELQERESRLAAMARLVDERLHNQQIHRMNRILSSYGCLPMRAEVEDDGSSPH